MAFILFIPIQTIVDNDGDHGGTEKSGKAALKKGYHKIIIQYYDGAGGNELQVFMQAENGSKTTIPPAILFHEK
jgi:hexosaminidase